MQRNLLFAFFPLLIFLMIPAYAEEPLKIGSIFIDNTNIFDTIHRELNKFPYTYINKLHIVTKEEVIRRELLFREGEILDEKLLEESARNLRSLGIFRFAEIVKLPSKDGIVDIIVWTQDAWSIEPQINFEGSGKDFEYEVGILEKNLLGYDKTVSVFYEDDVERNSVELKYHDPRLFGKFLNLNLHYEDTTDGQISALSFTRPFYSLATKWSAGLSGSDVEIIDSLYEDGEVVSEFEARSRDFTAFFGHILSYDKKILNRLIYSYSYSEDDFTDIDETDLTMFPEDRRYNTLGIRYYRQIVDYIKETYINRFEVAEDFNLGNTFSIFAGYSPLSLGSKVESGRISVSDVQGIRFGKGNFLLGGVSYSARFEEGEVRNAIQDIDIKYFYKFDFLLPQTLVVGLDETTGWNLYEDVQILLGGDSGLRGYPARQFTGDKVLLFNIEDRVFIYEDLLHLFSLGGVIFFDSGYVWKDDEQMDLRDLKSDAGIGIRIGLTRAANGAVMRLDAAYAFNEIDDEPSWLITFGSFQAF